MHWLLALIAFGIYVVVWAIAYKASGHQASTYYHNSYAVNPYIDNTSYSTSSFMFLNIDIKDAEGVGLSVLYAWLLWKFPLVLWVLHLTHNQESKGLRFASWIALLVLLLILDVLLTTYGLSFYGDWVFFGMYVVFGLIVVLVNEGGLGRAGTGALNCLIPWLLIALLYCIYSLFLPSLYRVYFDKESAQTAAFLIVYFYPAFDLIIYSLCLGLGTKIEPVLKKGFSMLQFMMIGYAVGSILNIGYTEV